MSTIKLKTTAFASALVPLLAIAGCGDKDESSASTTTQEPAQEHLPVTSPQTVPPRQPASSAIQIQMAMTGDIEVDVVKANAREGILTIVLTYRNNGKENTGIRYQLVDVYYIDDVEKKKYHVLKDSQGKWIAAPAARGMIAIETGVHAAEVKLPAGGKTTVWFKFPAPADNVPCINLVIPNVLPFERLALSR